MEGILAPSCLSQTPCLLSGSEISEPHSHRLTPQFPNPPVHTSPRPQGLWLQALLDNQFSPVPVTSLNGIGSQTSPP